MHTPIFLLAKKEAMLASSLQAKVTIQYCWATYWALYIIIKSPTSGPAIFQYDFVRAQQH